jgi:hypothetical protein
MKLEKELHTTATFDLIEKKEISSKNFETGKIAGSDQKYSGLKREKSLFLLFFLDKSKNKKFYN